MSVAQVRSFPSDTHANGFALSINEEASVSSPRERSYCDDWRGLPQSLKTAIKIAGVMAAQSVILGATFFYFSKDISSAPPTLLMDPSLPLPYRNPDLVTAATLCHTYVALPVIALRDVIYQYTPDITFQKQHISRVFIGAALEECVYRGVLQRALLPLIAKSFPRACKHIADHPITRVALSSLVFALAHGPEQLYTPVQLWPQFIGGLLYGASVEIEQKRRLVIPIMAHFLMNYSLGAGENL